MNDKTDKQLPLFEEETVPDVEGTPEPPGKHETSGVPQNGTPSEIGTNTPPIAEEGIDAMPEEYIFEDIDDDFDEEDDFSCDWDDTDIVNHDHCLDYLAYAINDKEFRPLELAERSVALHPNSQPILVYAAYVALIHEKPNLTLMWLNRLRKKYRIGDMMLACEAIAYGMQGKYYKAVPLIKAIDDLYNQYIPGPVSMKWINGWVRYILKNEKTDTPSRKRGRKKKNPPKTHIAEKKPAKVENHDSGLTEQFQAESLPEIKPEINISYTVDNKDIPEKLSVPINGIDDFSIKYRLASIPLLRSFDTLLCLSHFNNMEPFTHQIETVRKVLKQYHGRVLLADEVGLGKTIEAGMTIKEYMLRGMATNILVLTPASLVGQWQEEMDRKFDLSFVTTNDPRQKSSPEEFWRESKIIASISTAKRENSFSFLKDRAFDIIVVDEAHHLKNRNTKNWKLVDSLNKRFLLLLSATPIQNNLIELYNLLTLLKPGIFKTQKEFKNKFMVPGDDRRPANRDSLRGLMREVMIRNTRALTNINLPPRHAVTIRVDPSQAENESYNELNSLIKKEFTENHTGIKPMRFHHVLAAAGSAPYTASMSIKRYCEKYGGDRWRSLQQKYDAITESGKIKSLISLLRKNPDEKKIIFIRYIDTMNILSSALESAGIKFTSFNGSMNGPEKDATIEEFRTRMPVLLSTETGGEGRNLQFCNTLINFDLPWNPQVIEQRIGRVHRIGQERDVFIFNFTVKNTLEDHLLRVLDEKINMFELVVGEAQAILGEMDEEEDFSNIVFSTWLETTEDDRETAFNSLGEKLVEAKNQYTGAKALDDELFGNDFEAL